MQAFLMGLPMVRTATTALSLMSVELTSDNLFCTPGRDPLQIARQMAQRGITLV